MEKQFWVQKSKLNGALRTKVIKNQMVPLNFKFKRREPANPNGNQMKYPLENHKTISLGVGILSDEPKDEQLNSLGKNEFPN